MTLRTKLLILIGVATTAGLAFVVAPWTSSRPDGLQRVARDHSFADDEDPTALREGPLADYSVKGVTNRRLATGLAAAAGVLVTFGLAATALVIMRRRVAKPAKGDDP